MAGYSLSLNSQITKSTMLSHYEDVLFLPVVPSRLRRPGVGGRGCILERDLSAGMSRTDKGELVTMLPAALPLRLELIPLESLPHLGFESVFTQ